MGYKRPRASLFACARAHARVYVSLIASLLLCAAALPSSAAVRRLGSSLRELKAAAKDADPAIRLEAVIGLTRLDSAEAFKVVGDLLASDPNPDVRQMAALRLRLREGDPVAVEALVRAAEADPSPSVRAQTVRTLQGFKSQKARAAVWKAEADKDAGVRRAAESK